MGEGWFIKLRLADPKRTRRADGRGGLPGFRRGAALMRYLPLTDADRRDDAASDRRAVDRRAVPRRAGGGAARGRCSTCRTHACEMAVERHIGALAREEHRRRRGAVLPRLRRLPPPRPGGVDHLIQRGEFLTSLHALPARDRAGHAAISVRVPDAGRAADRHGGRQRLDVRRLDRLWEAIAMADRITRRDKAVLSGGLHPHYRACARPMPGSPATSWRSQDAGAGAAART